MTAGHTATAYSPARRSVRRPVRAYYNENNTYCAHWLRNLIAAGLIAPGDVDTRSIKDVHHDDLHGYTQAHFFAGLGGWALAMRSAGWPDQRPVWTGSCPCQPFSVAGKGKGVDDARHLWPDLCRLIGASRPVLVMGEQVAGAVGYAWLDGVRSDLEAADYACRAVDIPACSVNAPHIRNRLYWIAEWMADATGARSQSGLGEAGPVLYRDGVRGGGSGDGRVADAAMSRTSRQRSVGGTAEEDAGRLRTGVSGGSRNGRLGDPGRAGLSVPECEAIRGAGGGRRASSYRTK